MTDVFICYSREDRDRVRPIAEALQTEGWDVWWDPTVPLQGENDNVDRQLGSAGAVVVVWSAASRGSEYVRSEAATGLYKNKLIQIRIDSAHPPRPFDQVEVLDLGAWSGDRDDANWRRVVGAARLFAGAPGSERPQVRRASRPAPPASPPLSMPSRSPKPSPSSRQSKSPPLSMLDPDDTANDYLEPRGGLTVGPLIAAAALVVIGAGFWLLDPLGWRKPGVDAAATDIAATDAPIRTGARLPSGSPSGSAPLTGSASAAIDTPASETAWTKANRNSPVELRGLLTAYPGTSAAESARSLLRVLDAQAWADAVTADNEKAYSAYIQSFPANAEVPGAMVAAAQERLASLSSERLQAIADVQRALTAAKLYKGKTDGQVSEGTIKALRTFAQSHNRPMIDPKSAAPRDLRGFADLINSGGRAAPPTSAGSVVSAPAAAAPPATVAPAPQVRAAPAPAKAAAAPAAPSAASTAAAAADRARIQQAEEARKSAQKVAAEDAAAADILRKEAADWSDARALNTAAAYQAYLTAHPAGANASDARAAAARLNRPAAYSVAQLAPQVRQAVETARQVQATATARAAAARNTAARADAVAAAARSGSAGTQVLTAADGARYESQVSAGAPNGLGVKVSGGGVARGDKYRGELRGGLGVGLGVYEFTDNANNAQSGALRYEGEHANDQANGIGMTYWKNGDTFAGQETPTGPGRGVMTFANGQRYDGEMVNGKRSGYGVVWSADGQILMAGRFENGALVDAMTPPAQ